MFRQGAGTRRAPLVRRVVAWRLTVLLLCPALCGGCRTWESGRESAMSAWCAGDVAQAAERLEVAAGKMRSERELLKLDLSMVDLSRGEAGLAEGRFRELREELAYLDQRDLGEQTAATLSDSRASSYSGRDYERQMLLAMGLLSSVMSGSGDAFAWSLQAEETVSLRRRELSGASPNAGIAASDSGAEETSGGVQQAGYESVGAVQPKAADSPLGFASWLTALVQSETPSRAIETASALEQAAWWNAVLPGGPGSPDRMGVRCAKGSGSLNVIVLAGRAPRWESESAEPTSAALLIADRILSATGRHTLPPTLVSVKIARPRVVWRAGSAAPVVCRLRTGGVASVPRVLGFTTLADMNAAAESSYQEHRDEELAAAVVRRVVKKGAIYAVKETTQVSSNGLADFGLNAAGVLWEALERPDTRAWETLPAMILAAQEELPVGEHHLEILGPLPDFGARRGHGEFSVRIEDGRNTTVLCLIPDRAIAGCILVSGVEQKMVPPPAP